MLIATVTILLTIALSAQTYKGAKSQQTPEQKLNETYCTGLFKSTHGTILDVASDVSAQGSLNILDWMQGRVAGLQIYTSRMGVRFPIMRGTVPGIYVDEMPVSTSYLNALPVTDIAMVKIIKTPFYGGFNGGGGAIAVYTLRGEDEEEE